MSEKQHKRGSCLCGAVTIDAKQVSQRVGACHCNMCRKWGGGPLMAVDCGTDITFEGKDDISIYDSSAWAERAFCRQCGSHLFYRIKETQQHMLPAGIFDDSDAFGLSHQVFIDEKPAFYDFKNETKKLTGAEVFAMYAPDKA